MSVVLLVALIMIAIHPTFIQEHLFKSCVLLMIFITSVCVDDNRTNPCHVTAINPEQCNSDVIK